MPYESSTAESDVTLAWFGLRIIRAMQPSAAGGETAECVGIAIVRNGAGGPLVCRQDTRGARPG